MFRADLLYWDAWTVLKTVLTTYQSLFCSCCIINMPIERLRTSRGRRSRGQKKTTKTTLRSEGSSALKKHLTGPTLLELPIWVQRRKLGRASLGRGRSAGAVGYSASLVRIFLHHGLIQTRAFVLDEERLHVIPVFPNAVIPGRT